MKNILTYAADLPATAKLAEHLQELPFAELEPSQFSRAGFVPHPITRELVSEFPGGMAFCLRYDEKILPAAAVTAEVLKRVLAIEEQTGNGLTRKERLAIKEQVLAELVQKALVRSVTLYAYYHRDSKRLFVATASSKMGSLVMSQLIKVVGSVQTKTIHIEGAKKGLTTRLKTRIQADHDALDAFGLFEVGDHARLAKDGEHGKETINYSGTRVVECDELIEKLEQGYQVEALALNLDGLAFRLTHDFKLKGMEWISSDEQDFDSQTEAWQHDAAAKLFLLNKVIDGLVEIMAYREEGDSEEQAA
jgi:recombination associated protein RdgC